LLSLPEEVKEYVSRGTMSMGHARAIVALKDPEVIKQLAEQCVEQQWSVRELEETVKNLDRKPANGVKVKVVKRDPYIDNVEEVLRERFKTTVKIKQGKEKGKIELNYYSAQDLERLLELLGN
jgi:ParB family chromosome partitioning protein